MTDSGMVKLYLTGPKAGKSKVINGVTFINGMAEVNVDHKTLISYLRRYYKVDTRNPLKAKPESVTE